MSRLIHQYAKRQGSRGIRGTFSTPVCEPGSDSLFGFSSPLYFLRHRSHFLQRLPHIVSSDCVNVTARPLPSAGRDSCAPSIQNLPSDNYSNYSSFRIRIPFLTPLRDASPLMALLSSASVHRSRAVCMISQSDLARRTFASAPSHPPPPLDSKSSEDSCAPSSRMSDSGNSNPSPPHQGSGSVKGRAVRTGPVTWTSLLLLLVTGACLIVYFNAEKKKRLEGVRQGESVGRAAIGGPFSLTNHEGRAVTEKDFVGMWNLLYFGFTFCPDICPDELRKMAGAIEALEKKKGIKVRPIFVSVDPERDGVEQVRDYVKGFHPRMVGLTGSMDAVKAAAKQYRVYFMKTDDDKDNYLIDHSIIMYLMDPKMEFVKFFGRNHTVDSLTDGIAEEILSWEEKTK